MDVEVLVDDGVVKVVALLLQEGEVGSGGLLSN